jgi:hypothetical protein
MEYAGRRICYLKAAQSFGATSIEGLKDLHGMIKQKYKLGVLHAFPTNDEVEEFGKFFYRPLLANNKQAIGSFIKDTDMASLKKVGESFLHLRGARLSQKLGDTDEDTSSKTAGFSVDRVVFDETDFMDAAVIEKFKGRTYASPLKEEVYLGNPSHEDYGIDVIFKQSDQRYWFRRCTCGYWTCAEKSFPNCVKIRSNGKGYIGCDKCGKELPIWAGEGTGQWVADYPKNSEYMYGYHLSCLTNAFFDPAEIIKNLENPPNGNLADVYRLQLGRAYSAESDKLRKDVVLACCGKDYMPQKSSGPCAMGVDVGIIKHIVIGVRLGNDRYEILKVARCRDFAEIRDLAQRFSVKSAVIDLRPYEDEVRLFQKSEKFRIFLAEYLDSQAQEAAWNNNTGTVKIHRTGIFDATHRLLSRGQVRLPRQCPEIEQFAIQCCNCARFEEKNKRTKQIVYRYRPTGDRKVGDHYRSALNYFLLAAGSCSIARSEHSQSLQRFAKHETVKI